MLTFPCTTRTTAALERASREAARRGHDRIATRHLALGLLLGEDAPARALLQECGVEVDALCRRLESTLPRTRRPTGEAPLPYSPNAQRALAQAAQEARALGDRAPEPLLRVEHLLLALLALDGEVGRILRAAGARHETVRELAARATDVGGMAGGALAFLAVDPAAGTPVYQQIVDRVREAVAAGRLRPDDRLPTVRQLAADLGVAPGTTARAYQELEQLGVVVTGGPRGTRIARIRVAEVPEAERAATLVGLLRPVAVAASYLGASAGEIRRALEEALRDIYAPTDPAPADLTSSLREHTL